MSNEDVARAILARLAHAGHLVPPTDGSDEAMVALVASTLGWAPAHAWAPPPGWTAEEVEDDTRDAAQIRALGELHAWEAKHGASVDTSGMDGGGVTLPDIEIDAANLDAAVWARRIAEDIDAALTAEPDAETLALATQALADLESRKGEDLGVWARRLAAQAVAAGEHEQTACPGHPMVTDLWGGVATPEYAPEWLARMVQVAPDVYVPAGADGQPSLAVQRERQRPGETEAEWIRRVWGFTGPLLYQRDGNVTRYVGIDEDIVLAWPTGMWEWMTEPARMAEALPKTVEEWLSPDDAAAEMADALLHPWQQTARKP